MSPRSFFVSMGFVALALLTSCKPTPTETAPAKLSFTTDIRPLLEKHCVNCHHDGALMGDLKLQNRATAFATRAKGPVIIPGEPENSPLFKVLVLPGANPKAMPPEGHQIPAEQIASIKRWIAEGADWPEGPEGTVTPSPALP
jgi:mono/diheme cytochrome c family protein